MIYSDEELAANDGDLRGVTAPTGTGPFRFVDYIGQRKACSRSQPDYWNPELPYVDGIELLHVAAWADRGTAVLTGQADFSWNVSVDTWEEGSSQRRH
ncbi:MAG: ABC transporter substrate-binding protein [Caldilineaceae bacterium]